MLGKFLISVAYFNYLFKDRSHTFNPFIFVKTTTGRFSKSYHNWEEVQYEICFVFEENPVAAHSDAVAIRMTRLVQSCCYGGEEFSRSTGRWKWNTSEPYNYGCRYNYNFGTTSIGIIHVYCPALYKE